MKFVKKYASDWDFHQVIEVKSLKALLKLIKDEGEAIIMSVHPSCDTCRKTGGANWEIQVYDYYVE